MVRARRAVLCWAALAVLAVAAAGCSEPAEEEGRPDGEAATQVSAPDCAGDDLLECARRSSLEPLVPAEPSAAAGEPLVLGMMNIESSPAGSYAELSAAVQAAVEFVNTELGGVAGRPVQVDVCNTGFSAEGSAACAQRFLEQGVPAVVGGIDVFGDGIRLLAEAGVPYAGGIPVSEAAVTAGSSFQWSGGTWGATVAFADHAAAELGAERVSIVYGEFGPISQSAEYGATLLRSRDVEVQLVPYPVTAADLTPALQAAVSSRPDAVILLGADTGCSAAFEAIEALRIEVPTFHTGACATPSILDDVAPEVLAAAVFNVEGPISLDEPDPDTELYGQVVERYGDGLDPVGAGTVSFRSFMNLWAVLHELGDDELTSSAILEELRAARNRPSFMGHPYTCDGEQFEGLPAMCSPQQILARRDGAELVQLGSWIDVGTLYADALGAEPPSGR